MANLQIKLKKSTIGSKKDQIATVRSQPDNPQTRGKIKKVSHLIEVTEA